MDSTFNTTSWFYLAFEKMRDGMIVVNTSRGPVIDENALVDALESGKVLRAALDVYEV